MTPEEELAMIDTFLEEQGIPKFKGLARYSTYGRVTLLAEKYTQPMTEQRAREMIAMICEYLEKGAPGAVVDDPIESVTAKLARDFCGDLLAAADADGLDGCPLCQC